MSTAPPDGRPPTIDEQLDALQLESEARRVELREIAAQLPEAMSRRAILRAVAADVRHAPEKGDIAGRGLRKVGRVLGHRARSLRRRLARTDR